MIFSRFIRKYKHLLLISIVMLSAIGIVSVLTASTLRPINQKNGFDRKFVSASAKVLHAIPKDIEVVEISGSHDNDIYFKTLRAERIFITNTDLGNPRDLVLNMPYNRKISRLCYPFVKDSGHVEILAGKLPAIIKVHTVLPGKVKRFPAGSFTRVVKINSNTFVFRGFDSTLKAPDQIFVKGDAVSGILTRENNISELNGDAGLSTDGLLHYDETTNRLVYVHFYRNEFICMDTNLVLEYKKHTVDTSNTNKIIVGKTSSGEKETITNASPRRMINKRNCTYQGKLYNYSKLKGDNETDEDFEKNAAIDVYDVLTGQYEGSFYIPYYKNEKIQQFSVVQGKIVAIYKTHIVSYQLPSLLNDRTKKEVSP